jgi:hypothetical protein
MAPIPPLGRERVLALVAEGSLPLHFGSPHPSVAVVEQDGLFRIRDLVIDPEEAEASRAAALAQQRSWMPEQYYELGRPTGTIHCEAATREALMEQLRAMPWPQHW